MMIYGSLQAEGVETKHNGYGTPIFDIMVVFVPKQINNKKNKYLQAIRYSQIRHASVLSTPKAGRFLFLLHSSHY